MAASGSARSLFQVRLGGWSCCHDHDLSVEARDRVCVWMALWVCICEENSNLHILKAVLSSLFYPSWGWHVLLQAFRYFSAFVTSRICSQSEKLKVEIELYESAEKDGKKPERSSSVLWKGSLAMAGREGQKRDGFDGFWVRRGLIVECRWGVFSVNNQAWVFHDSVSALLKSGLLMHPSAWRTAPRSDDGDQAFSVIKHVLPFTCELQPCLCVDTRSKLSAL